MKHFEVVITKMCEAIQIDRKDIDIEKEDWYLRYEWSSTQRDGFLKWFQDYLWENKEARKEIMKYPRKNRKDIKKLVEQFDFQCGWKLLG